MPLTVLHAGDVLGRKVFRPTSSWVELPVAVENDRLVVGVARGVVGVDVKIQRLVPNLRVMDDAGHLAGASIKVALDVLTNAPTDISRNVAKLHAFNGISFVVLVGLHPPG